METVRLKSHVIRRAEKSDVSKIIKYLEKEWSPNHIFVKSPEFFEYEHCRGDKVNGILAENLETGEIDGILLMYPVADDVEGIDFFGGIWSVSHSCKTPMLGYKLIENVLKVTGAKSHSGVGINPNTTARIFRGINGQRVGKLFHYYMLNDCTEYKVACVENRRIKQEKNGVARFITLSSISELNSLFPLKKYKEMPFYKDENYVERRYFKHPIYDYKVVAVSIDDAVEAIVIYRVIECNGAKIARIIDFLGEEQALSECGVAFQNLMNEEMLEYIDFYQYGLSDNVLKDAGFSLKDENDSNIIPNYFEPYLQNNIDIWFHTPYEKCRIFKGDGDQDRPSRVN